MKESTMSGCEAHLSILHIPEPLRTSNEQGTLQGHLLDCDLCHARALRLAEAIDAFRTAPDPELPQHLAPAILERVAKDWNRGTRTTHSTAPAKGTLPGGVAPRARSADTFAYSWWRRAREWIGARSIPNTLAPVVAAVLVVIIAIPLARQETGVRDKSPGSAMVRPSIDLQTTIERVAPRGTSTLTRAEDGMTIGPEDGLLFQFSVEGISQLSLIECDPQHGFRVLFNRGRLDPSGGGIVPLTGPGGQLLRYTPDGPPGEYVYLAVASAEPFTLNAELMDTVWNRYIDRILDPLEAGGLSGLAIDAVRLRYEIDPDELRRSRDTNPR